MAEFTNANTVSVAAGQNVPLTEKAVAGKGCVVHREGAGIVTLRGITNQCKARFKVGFGANVAIPTGGTVEAITAALAINGEPLNSATATVTPAAVENFFNISDCQKIAFLPYCVCRGDHWSPANLPQQRIFPGGLLTRQTGTGEQCSPLQEFFDSLNIYVTSFVEVPRGCCLTVAAENTSTQTVLFANANFVVERVS